MTPTLKEKLEFLLAAKKDRYEAEEMAHSADF